MTWVARACSPLASLLKITKNWNQRFLLNLYTQTIFPYLIQMHQLGIYKVWCNVIGNGSSNHVTLQIKWKVSTLFTWFSICFSNTNRAQLSKAWQCQIFNTYPMLAHIPTFMWAPIWILIPIGIQHPQICFLGFQCPDQCPVQWPNKIVLKFSVLK